VSLREVTLIFDDLEKSIEFQLVYSMEELVIVDLVSETPSFQGILQLFLDFFIQLLEGEALLFTTVREEDDGGRQHNQVLDRQIPHLLGDSRAVNLFVNVEHERDFNTDISVRLGKPLIVQLLAVALKS